MSPYIFEVTIKASNIIVKNWLVSKAIFKLNKSFSSFTLSSATSSLSSLFAFLNFCSLFVMILERVTTRNSLDVTAQRYHRQGPSYSLNLGKKTK